MRNIGYKYKEQNDEIKTPRIKGRTIAVGALFYCKDNMSRQHQINGSFPNQSFIINGHSPYTFEIKSRVSQK